MLYIQGTLLKRSQFCFKLHTLLREGKMRAELVQTPKPIEIVRVDQVTGDVFPVKSNVSCLGAAKLNAEAETDKRKPNGDIFLVIQGERVLYDPSRHEC